MQPYNGYVPGPDGKPTRNNAKFELKTRKISLPGKPVETKTEPFIKVYHSDSIDTTFRPATDEDKAMYPAQWAAFEAGQDQDALGWPIEKAPFLDEAQAQSYRDLGIKSLEALAQAHDNVIAKIMGGREHRQKAQTLLKEAIDKKPMMDALTKVEEQAKELADLRAQMAQLLEAQKAQPVAAPTQATAVQVKGGRRKASEMSGLPPAVLPESDD